MSPEQARSEKVLTTSVDVYSLGAILYELLTAEAPFHAATPLDTVLQVLERDRVEIEEGGNLRPFVASGVNPSPDHAASILNPPGLVGKIARWINATSIYPQPMLAVAAAITAAGVAMSHKVQSPTRLRTNFYTMGLAPSGAGKAAINRP